MCGSRFIDPRGLRQNMPNALQGDGTAIAHRGPDDAGNL